MNIFDPSSLRICQSIKHFIYCTCHNICISLLRLYCTHFYKYIFKTLCTCFFNINILAKDIWHFRLAKREINDSTRIRVFFIRLLHNAEILQRVKESHVILITAYSDLHKFLPTRVLQ